MLGSPLFMQCIWYSGSCVIGGWLFVQEMYVCVGVQSIVVCIGRPLVVQSKPIVCPKI